MIALFEIIIIFAFVFLVTCVSIYLATLVLVIMDEISGFFRKHFGKKKRFINF